jgi:hypothetical protein
MVRSIVLIERTEEDRVSTLVSETDAAFEWCCVGGGSGGKAGLVVSGRCRAWGPGGGLVIPAQDEQGVGRTKMSVTKRVN